MMQGLVEDVPARIDTARLVVRMVQPTDGPRLNAAVCESIDDLRPTMPWAQTAPTLAQSDAECRRLSAQFLIRQNLAFFIFERHADGTEGDMVGGTGLHRIDWKIRRFEIGYWCRSSCRGRGFIHEAVIALAELAFDALRARRVEVRMDDTNLPSRRVAERAGFTLEGVLRNYSLTPQGELRDTRVYSRIASLPLTLPA